MADFALDSSDWDLRFIDGDLAVVAGIEETNQNSKFRLQIMRGEVFEDNRIGVPWITDMVDPRVSIDAKKQILRSTILAAPGVISLNKLEIKVDNSSGLAEVEFSGIAEGGAIFGGTLGSADPAKGLTNAAYITAVNDLYLFANYTMPGDLQ